MFLRNILDAVQSKLGYTKTTNCLKLLHDNIKTKQQYQDKIKILEAELQSTKVQTSKNQLGKLKRELREKELELYKIKTYGVETQQIEVKNKDTNRLKNWSDIVRKEAGYKCDICNSNDNLSAHHLYDKSTHTSLMYIPDNGVCLCNTCHEAFHKKYTSKSHCTPKMYEKFKIIRKIELNLIKDI